ncbi:MAG: hypothetical protein ABIA93_00920 [Candidatus Woesearchaeota archaeon]
MSEFQNIKKNLSRKWPSMNKPTKERINPFLTEFQLEAPKHAEELVTDFCRTVLLTGWDQNLFEKVFHVVTTRSSKQREIMRKQAMQAIMQKVHAKRILAEQSYRDAQHFQSVEGFA